MSDTPIHRLTWHDYNRYLVGNLSLEALSQETGLPADCIQRMALGLGWPARESIHAAVLVDPYLIRLPACGIHTNAIPTFDGRRVTCKSAACSGVARRLVSEGNEVPWPADGGPVFIGDEPLRRDTRPR